MMAAVLHAAAVAPAALPWLDGAARKSHAITLATLRRWRYPSQVPDKEGNGFDSLNNESAQPRNAAFLCACTFASLQRAAMAGAFGLLVCFRASLSTCHLLPTPFDSGRRSNRNEGGHHA